MLFTGINIYRKSRDSIGYSDYEYVRDVYPDEHLYNADMINDFLITKQTLPGTRYNGVSGWSDTNPPNYLVGMANGYYVTVTKEKYEMLKEYVNGINSKKKAIEK